MKPQVGSGVANPQLLSEDHFLLLNFLNPEVNMFNEDFEHSSLKGKLILANPSLRDLPFMHSVIILTQHDREHGAFGYILNRRIEQKLDALIGATDLPPEVLDTLAHIGVFFGGPVSTEQLTFAALNWSEMEGNLQIITHLSAQEACRYYTEGFQIRAFIGYSGWSEGQLEDEMKRNTWVLHEPVPDLMDPKKDNLLWKSILCDISPLFKLIVDEPEDPSLN